MENSHGRTFWTLIQTLTDRLYREMARLRRARDAGVPVGAKRGRDRARVEPLPGRDPFVFSGRAQALECVAWRHFDPTRRPKAWIVLEFRLGPEQGRDAEGRSVWAKSLMVEVRLPEAHWGSRKVVQTKVPTHTYEAANISGWVDRLKVRSKNRRVNLLLEEALKLARKADQERLANQGTPFMAKPLWIDPKRTPKEVTQFHLLLYLWQEEMIALDPERTPEAWEFVKTWLRSKSDAHLWLVLSKLRRGYALPEDWRALRKYIGRVMKSERPRPTIRMPNVRRRMEFPAVQW